MEDFETKVSGNIPEDRLWTANFFILWQGQLVSLFGDVIYSLALGFWVLNLTGSISLMGALMASSTLPGLLVSPFAGVIVDRYDRRKLLILMDVIRGAAVVLLSILLFYGYTLVWTVFVTGMILSICGAFYSPGVNSTIPDIIPRSKILRANSLMGVVQNGSNLIGSSAGGFLYQMLGAPFLFFLNGLTFFLSAFLNFFLKIPKIKRMSDQHFLADIAEGYGYVWKSKGLRLLLLVTSISNFFTFIAIVLFLPMFQKTEGLGPVKYGIALAFFSGGNMLAMLVASLINIKPSIRHRVFMFAALSSNIFFILSILNSKVFLFYLSLMAAGGFFMALLNVLINSIIQLTVPRGMRGKVFSLMGMVTSSLIPIGMAVGGVLGEIFTPKGVSIACFIIVFIVNIPLVYSKAFKGFINFNTEESTQT